VYLRVVDVTNSAFDHEVNPLTLDQPQEDEAGLAAWGFSPKNLDTDDGAFLYAWKTNETTVWFDLLNPQEMRVVIHSTTSPGTWWGFSPCGDVFGMINGNTKNLRLFRTSDGAELPGGGYTGMAMELKPRCTLDSHILGDDFIEDNTADEPCQVEDVDGDNIGDDVDNCPDTPNSDQDDSDGDGIGDACDGDFDTDGDGIPNDIDKCPEIASDDQTDTDTDGVGNICDNCPDEVNPDQADIDGDGVGDACSEAGGSPPTWPTDPPSTLTATNIGETSLVLTWTTAHDDVDVTGYIVYRSTDYVNYEVVAQVRNVLTHGLSGLTPDFDYWFKVEARDDDGNLSTGGPTAYAHTSDSSAPTWPYPAILDWTDRTATSLTIAWSAAQDNVAVSGYRIYRRVGAEWIPVVTVEPDVLTYHFSCLEPYHFTNSYTFKVEAFDEAGNESADGPQKTMYTKQGQECGTYTERVNVSSSGQQTWPGVGDEGQMWGVDSSYPDISADGRYVAFQSDADNLVENDNNTTSDIFLRDRQSGDTGLISGDSGGSVGWGISDAPAISADGRYIAFASTASLVANDVNSWKDIYVHDTETGQNRLASVDNNSIQGNHHSWYPVISANGRFVAFSSQASNLVPNDYNDDYLSWHLTNLTDVFVYDLENTTIERVSVSTEGTEGNAGGHMPAISANGRYVAFESYAFNLVSDDTNICQFYSWYYGWFDIGCSDVFVHDRQEHTTVRISLSTGGAEGNSHSRAPDISDDGRYVVFKSSASNLVSNDTNGLDDIFLHDRETGKTARISVSGDGIQANGTSDNPAISPDGRYISFSSSASNLIPDDDNDEADVFVFDRLTGNVERVSICPCGGDEANGGSHKSALSSDGYFVAFESQASNLVPDLADTNQSQDIFVYAQQNRIAVADLGVTKTDSPDPVAADEEVTYTITATNNGPDEATNVMVTDRLPTGSNVGFVTAVPSQGTCQSFAGIVTCELDDLSANSTATVSIIVQYPAQSTFTNEVFVQCDEFDSDETNNTTTEETTVVSASVEPRISVTPTSLLFPDTAVGGALELPVTISSVGSADLTITAIGAGDPLESPFAIVDDDCSNSNCSQEVVPPQESRVLTVRFDPTDPGGFSGGFDIASDDPDDGTIQVSVNGTAIQDTSPLLFLFPDTVEFNTTETQGVFSVHNTGFGDLHWNVGPFPDWLSASPAGGTTPAGTSTAVILTVDRSALIGVGLHTYALPVTSDGGNGQVVVMVTHEPITIPDMHLEAAIRNAIGKPVGDIFAADLQGLQELIAVGPGIHNLTGLEYCSNLEHLNLSENAVADLSPISNLTMLTYLNLNDNHISNISPLGQLQRLEYLNLGTNHISNISYLLGLINLTDLYLGENAVRDLISLRFLGELKNLDLHSNRLDDISVLVQNLGLGQGDRVWLEDNNLDWWPTSDDVHNIRALQDRGATVTHNPVDSLFADPALDAAVRDALNKQPGDIIIPQDLVGLTTLDALNRGIINLTGMQFCVDLTTLYLQDNAIFDLTPLSGLTELVHLNLTSNAIVDISALSNLTNLVNLYLSNNHIVDIGPLAGLENLDNLALSFNEIEDLSALANNFGLGQGDSVWVTNNNLDLSIGSPVVAQLWSLSNSGVAVHHDDMGFADANLDAAMRDVLGKQPGEAITLEDLNMLQQITDLGVYGINRGIIDLSGIEVCISLTSLDLAYNDITDISSLSNLEQLTVLHLGWNNISDIYALTNLKNLTNLILSSNQIVDITPLSYLTSLSYLDLKNNDINDILPLVNNGGLAQGDTVDIRVNNLDLWEVSEDVLNIRRLERWGVTVLYDPITRFFLDENLETAVAIVLSGIFDITIQPGAITYAMLEDPRFTSLDGSNRGIAYLDGIEYCMNLTELILSGNPISDLSPLSSLENLTHLHLTNCQITDISPLAQIETLTHLYLRGNNISNVNPLVYLPDLYWVNLSYNNISDISHLTAAVGLGDDDDEDWNNDRLIIHDNPLDWAVGSATVRYLVAIYRKNVIVVPGDLYFPDANLEAILWGVMEDIMFDAWGYVPDPPRVGPMYLDLVGALDVLDADGESIHDITGMEYCTGLEQLSLRNNQISDITPLADLTNLVTLRLDGNQIASVGPLVDLTNLIELSLSDNQIGSVSPLMWLADIGMLDLAGNQITDISHLLGNLGLANGDELWITGNPLDLWAGSDTVRYIGMLKDRGATVHHDPIFFFIDANLDAVIREELGKDPDEEISEAELQGITQMIANNKGITDLSGMEFCTGLTSLSLDYNQITNVEPLAQLITLISLSLAQNQIVDISPLSGLVNLQSLRLQSNQIKDISCISGLQYLTILRLGSNRIRNILPLVANIWLGQGDEIWLYQNDLNLSLGSDTVAYIQNLKDRGAIVHHDQIVAKGDINGDSAIDLADAVLALQVSVRMEPPGVHRSTDVNDDDRFGMAEAIFILQNVAGLR